MQASKQQISKLVVELDAATEAHADAESGRAAQASRSSVAAVEMAALQQQLKQAEEHQQVRAPACLLLYLCLNASLVLTVSALQDWSRPLLIPSGA